MHARVITNHLRPGKMEQRVALIRDSIAPFLGGQHGFHGFVVLTNPDAGKSIGDPSRRRSA